MQTPQMPELTPEMLQQLMQMQQMNQDPMMQTQMGPSPDMQQQPVANIPPELMEEDNNQLIAVAEAFGNTIEFYNTLLQKDELKIDLHVNALNTMVTAMNTFVQMLIAMQGTTGVKENSPQPERIENPYGI